MKRKILSMVCISAGLALLAVPFFFSLYGEMRSRQLLKEIEETILANTGHKEVMQEDEEETSPDKAEKAVYQKGDVIGMIEIEALDLKYPVMEGAGNSQLNTGIGHIPDTAGIGETGNCVLAGHRGSRYGTYFKHLNRISIGDEIKLTDQEGNVWLYEAADTKVVGPYDNSVKNQGEENVLTLLTCENSGTMRLVITCIRKKKASAREKMKLDKYQLCKNQGGNRKMEYLYGDVEEHLREKQYPSVPDTRIELGKYVIHVSGTCVYLPKFQVTVHEGLVCLSDRKNKKFEPEYGVTVILDRKSGELLHDEEADFLECVHHWLKEKVSIEELSREKCFVEGLKEEIYEKCISDKRDRRSH